MSVSAISLSFTSYCYNKPTKKKTKVKHIRYSSKTYSRRYIQFTQHAPPHFHQNKKHKFSIIIYYVVYKCVSVTGIEPSRVMSYYIFVNVHICVC